MKFARGAGLIVLGALLLLEPGLAGRIAIIVGGVLLALVGAAQLSGDGPQGRAAPRPGTARAAPARGHDRRRARRDGGSRGDRAARAERHGPRVAALTGACNGSRTLCGRRLNEVVFPATHNSFAAADEPGWLFANQRHGIERQLRDGIRGFLIDIHYGVVDPERGRVRTDLKGEDSSRNKVAQQLSPRALRTADRLAGRVGASLPTGKRSALHVPHALRARGRAARRAARAVPPRS